MKKILLASALLFFVATAFSQFTYKIKADSVLITNDSCNAELNLENSTRNVNGFLYNKGNGRTEFRKGLIKLDDSTYLIGADTIKTLGGSSGNYIKNQYASKQTASAWIDTLKSVILNTDTLRTKIIDAGGMGTAFVPDLNTGIWIRPKSDTNTIGPRIQYESAKPHLAVGHINNNFGTDSIWQNSTPLYAYRRMVNSNEARMTGSLYGWGKNNIYGNNLMPAGKFGSTLLLDTSSTTYTFQGGGVDFTAPVLSAGYSIGASKNVSGITRFNAGNSPPHALRIGSDFNPAYTTPTQQFDGFWYNALSALKFGGGPNSYIDRFAHYYAMPFTKQTSYGHIKSGYAFYAGSLYQDGIDRAWGFYSEGVNDRSYLAGQLFIGDTTVANGGTNKLYVAGKSLITDTLTIITMGNSDSSNRAASTAFVRNYLNVGGASNNSWNLAGNSGTNPSTNFLGTTDSANLIFKTAAAQRASIFTDGTFNIAATDTASRPQFRIYPNGDFAVTATNNYASGAYHGKNGLRYNRKLGILEIGLSNNIDTSASQLFFSIEKSGLIINTDGDNTIAGIFRDGIITGDAINLTANGRISYGIVAGEAHYINGSNTKNIVTGYGHSLNGFVQMLLQCSIAAELKLIQLAMMLLFQNRMLLQKRHWRL